jgi:hypothetical protein
MSSDVLLRFLQTGLINVGGDDGKLEKLKETAVVLAESFKEKPRQALDFALIAFDPDAPAEAPAVIATIDALKSRWNTYVNTFSGTPILVLRAIMLDALVGAAEEDDAVAIALASAARNVLPFMALGSEGEIWGDVIADVEKRVDQRAEADWATPDSIKVAALDFPRIEPIRLDIESAKVDREALISVFQGAAGPHSSTGPTGGNPNWPGGNQPWVTEFGNRMAAAVGNAIEDASVDIPPIAFDEPLSQLATAVSSHVDSVLTAISGATAGLQRRTRLLWWKEAMFSPCSRVSYRELTNSNAAALMAFDLSEQLPQFSPASVPAFLRETVRRLGEHDHDAKIPVRRLLEDSVSDKHLTCLVNAAARLTETPKGRGPLLALVGHCSSRTLPSGDEFRRLTGVAEDTELTVSEWATWIFRELQALRALSEAQSLKDAGQG